MQHDHSEIIINFSALCEIASAIRNVTCHLESRVKFGGAHMIRQLTFNDDVHWIVRMRMPRVGVNKQGNYSVDTDHWTEASAAAMESEVYTMMYIREHSTIPVPEVFDFNTSFNNPVGAPYILMECIMGNSVTDLSGGYCVPERYEEKLHDAIAKFQVFVSSIARNFMLTGDLGRVVRIAFQPNWQHYQRL